MIARSFVFRIAFAIGCLLAFAPVLSAQEDAPKTDRPAIVATEEQPLDDTRLRIEAEFTFAQGMKYFLLEDYERALELFADCRELNAIIDPDKAAIPYMEARCHQKIGRYEPAVEAAREAVSKAPDNEDCHLLLAQVYGIRNDYAAIAQAYARLIEVASNPKEDYYIKLASAYIQTDEFAKAVETYGRYEARFGVSEESVRQKQRIFVNHFGDPKRAIAEDEKLLAAFPDVAEYQLYHAKLLIQNDRLKEAQRLLEEFREEYPENKQASILLSQIYGKEGKADEQLSSLESAFASTGLSFEKKIDILVKYLQEDDPSKRREGRKLAAIAVQAHPGSHQAHSIYANFLRMAGQSAEAREHYVVSLQLNGDNLSAWRELLKIDWEFRESDSLIEHSELALEFFPNQSELYLYSGNGYDLGGDYASAVAAYETGRMMSIDAASQSRFDAHLGDTYSKTDQNEKAIAAYESALALDPANAFALNSYSYYLTRRGESLKKALSLSERLIGAHPEQAAYLDTHAWAHYALGDYKQARKYLEMALEQEAENATVLEHYGDTLFKLGEKDAALAQWRKARAATQAENALLDRKLAEERLIE